MIKLVEADHTIGVWELEVDASQKAHVASRDVILARAYLCRKLRSRAFWVCDDDSAVGMAMYHDCPEKESYDFSQLFIDKRYQGRGYGKAPIKLVLDEMKRDEKYSKVTMCYVEGNEASRKLFEQFGFVETSHSWDEIFMEMDLKNWIGMS